MSESLPGSATTADDKEKKVLTTLAHDTRQMGGDFSATIDLSKQNNPDVGAEKVATPEEAAAEAAPEPENLEEVIAGVQKEKEAASKQLEAFDANAAKIGKPLENSEFLDRAGLLEKSMSLDLLDSQKRIALLESSPEVAVPAVQAEIARLKEERKKAIETYKSKVDIQAAETAMRATEEIGKEPYTELSQVAAKSLAKGFARQRQLRANLETLDMSPEEIQAFIAEATGGPALNKEGKPMKIGDEDWKYMHPEETVEEVIAQLRPDGESAEKAPAPTEKVDTDLRVALLNLAEITAGIVERSGTEQEKSLFRRILENLRSLEQSVSGKAAGEAKLGIKEALGVGGQEEGVSIALSKFTQKMEADKKGKGGSFFKNLMGKIGQLSWVKKGREFFNSVKTKMNEGLEWAKGIKKIGGEAVKTRLEGLLMGQFGPLDLGKSVGGKTEGGAGTTTTETSKIETTPESGLAGVNAQLAALDAEMEAFGKAHPGDSNSLELRSIMAKYAPLRARFDELSKTGAPEAEKPESAEAVIEPSADENLQETPAPEVKPEEAAATSTAEGAEAPSGSSNEVLASAFSTEIMADLDGEGAKLAAQFNTESFAGLLSSNTGAVDALLASAWEGVDSEKAELVKNRILYHTLTKDPNIPDTVKPYILEALQKRGYLTYKEENGKYTFNRPKF